MNKNRQLLYVFLLLQFLLIDLHGQSAFTTSGGIIASSDGSATYSIGQVFYTDKSGTNGSLTEGVLHAYDITDISAINNHHKINLSVSVYPNPTTDFLTLSIESPENENLSYSIYDISGVLIGSETILSERTTIDMAKLKPATYLIKLTENNQEIKTYKVIKY